MYLLVVNHYLNLSVLRQLLVIHICASSSIIPTYMYFISYPYWRGGGEKMKVKRNKSFSSEYNPCAKIQGFGYNFFFRLPFQNQLVLLLKVLLIKQKACILLPFDCSLRKRFLDYVINLRNWFLTLVQLITFSAFRVIPMTLPSNRNQSS